MADDCMTCVWAHPLVMPGGKIDFTKKICKRMPPVPIPVQQPNGVQMGIAHPVVGRTIWCGEYQLAAHIAEARADGD